MIKAPLTKSFSFAFGLQLLLIIALGGLIISLYNSQKKLSHSRDAHFNSYLLADELRQSSDDLTRLARTYTITGDSKYEEQYWAVLGIRDGDIPRPVDYNRIYWDLVTDNGDKPRPDGEAVSLRDLMVQEGFTDAELAQLSEAQENSNYLVEAETVAMNAVKGLFMNESGEFVIEGDPDFALAANILNNEEYHEAKAGIMGPIDEFYEMFENRTNLTIEQHFETSNILIISIIILIAFITGLSSYFFISFRRQILSNEQLAKSLEEKVKERTAALESLNRDLENRVVIRTRELTKIKNNLEQEVGDRTKDLESRVSELKEMNTLMTGRELKMIEMKERIDAMEKRTGN